MEFSADSYCHLEVYERERLLLPHCYRARTGRARRRGLLGRSALERNCGVLLGEGLVHMWRMSFALDLVFLDRHGRVLKIVVAAPPGLRLYGAWRARQTLELAAGVAADVGINVGSPLVFCAQR